MEQEMTYHWLCRNLHTNNTARDSMELPLSDAIRYDLPLKRSFGTPQDALNHAKRHVLSLGLYGHYQIEVYTLDGNGKKTPVRRVKFTNYHFE